MEDGRRVPNWPVIAGVAALAGFGASHWLLPTQPTAVPPPTASSPDPAKSGPAQVAIPAAYIVSANISVEPVASGGVASAIVAPATVTATPTGEALVVARASGTVTRVTRRLGDPVRAGEVLAMVDSLDAATMASDRSVAAAKVDLARKRYVREAGLFAQGVTPRQDTETAQSELAVAQAELRRAAAVAAAAHVAGNGRSVSVLAPISGKITAENATLGAFVEPRTELFRIANAGAVQVEASVSAADARLLSPGDAAAIIVEIGAPVPAVVRSVTPTVSGATQAATVLLTPLSASRDLVIGGGVQVRLSGRDDSGVGGMTVPEEAVQNIDGRDVLFVRTAKGFRVQSVLVGTRSGGMAQIISGVAPGTQVATRNAFLVKAEMNKSAGGDE